MVNTYAGGQPAGNGTFVPGIDIIDAKLDATLAGKTDVDVIVTTTVGTTILSSKPGIKVSCTSSLVRQ